MAANVKTGLYFGSFNPVHIGHLLVADALLELAGLDEIWLVVSPQNPFKEAGDLAPGADRLAMVELAVAGNARLKPCYVEFSLPRPSYTVQTLRKLQADYPERLFSLLLGGDSLAQFTQWKDYGEILTRVELHAYNRPNAGPVPEELAGNPRVHRYDVPLLEVSSTDIRARVGSARSIRYRVPEAVRQYIFRHALYGHRPVATP